MNYPLKRPILFSMVKGILGAFLFPVILLFSCAGQETLEIRSSSVYGKLEILAGISFPPYSGRREIGFTIRKMQELSLDRMRLDVDWRYREPEKGVFYWKPMDLRMEKAHENHIALFLTIPSQAPPWAALPPGKDGSSRFDEEALKHFIEELLLRYDNIEKIQFGNEWETDHPDSPAYGDYDSIKQFVLYNNILYDSVKRLSPETQVVLGGLTRTYPMMEAFVQEGRYPDFSGLELAKGATEEYLRGRIDKIAGDYKARDVKGNVEYVLKNARYDMIDIHLYDDPENWSEYLSVLPEDKPVVVSEFGGPNSEFESTAPSYQAKRMADYIAAIEGLPIVEAYYFKLVDSDLSYHRDSGLYRANLRPKPAKDVFSALLSAP